MSDSSGLMAPIPSRKRQEFEERIARERGLGGLMSALAEPFTYLPQPAINVPATIAENIGREGWATGLLKSWDALMPAVRNARGVLNVYRKAEKAAPASDVLRIIKKGITSPEAEEFYRDTGTWIDPAGNTLREIPDVNARLTPKFLDELEKRILGTARGPFKGEAKDFLSHPELFGRYPQLEQLPLEIAYDPARRSGTYHPGRKISMSVTSSPSSAADVMLHELNHAVQGIEGLPQGTSVDNILFRLMLATGLGKLPKPAGWEKLEGLEQANKLEPLARKLYFLTEGELASRGVEERRLFNRYAREGNLPTLYGTAPLRGFPAGVPQEMRVTSPDDEDVVARIALQLLGIQAD